MKAPVLAVTVLTLSLTLAGVSFSQETVPLPSPRIKGDFMKALQNRGTAKGFRAEELPAQTVSEILWAAFGVNDPRTGRRTAASAFNVREMEIYVLTRDGGFRYDSAGQALERITGEDLRGILATQEYARNVPLHLVYVANRAVSRTGYPSWAHPMIEEYSSQHTGMIAQNVYLYCAAKGLGTVVRDVVNGDALHEKLKLDPDRVILMSQAVGYPGKK